MPAELPFPRSDSLKLNLEVSVTTRWRDTHEKAGHGFLQAAVRIRPGRERRIERISRSGPAARQCPLHTRRGRS